MKFGKSYLDALARPDFPEEWRKGAIEYKQLKKLINGVVAELEGLGLSQSVLGELLDQQARDKAERKAALRHRKSASHSRKSVSAHDTQDSRPHTAQDWLEQVSHTRPRRHHKAADPGKDKGAGCDPSHGARPEASDADETDKARSSPPQVLRQLLSSDYATESEVVEVRDSSPEAHGDWVHGAGGRRAHAAYELAGEADHPVPRIRITIESPVTSDASDAESDELGPPSVRLPSPSLGTYPPSVASSGRRRHRDRPSAQVEKQAADEADAEADSEPDEGQGHAPLSPSHTTSTTVVHRGEVPTSLAETELELAFQDNLALESGTSTKDLTVSPRHFFRPSAKTRSTHSRSLPTSPDVGRKKPLVRRVRRRQVVIPLLADAQFLDLLTQALVAVQSVQSLQRKEFIAATTRLTEAIAQATSPTGKNQQDLYAWREIFQLWTDAQIFESTREADAGELPPDESERRLREFADELHRRGWLQGPLQASRIDTTETLAGAQSASASSQQDLKAKLPLHRIQSSSEPSIATRHAGHPQGKMPGFHLPVSHLPASSPVSHHLSAQSEQALQDFMALNVTLLDVKKYQQVNLEAARKILKKHDKRTALSAGTDLKQLLASVQLGQSSEPSSAYAGSTEKLPPPPDPVAIANALANEQTQEPHRVRHALRKRWKKPINVAGLNLGGSVGGQDSTSGTSAPSPSGSTPTGPPMGAGPNSAPAPAKVPAPPSIGALVPATTKSARSTTDAGAGKDQEESLGHILFSLMSSQLLPILPSLDEVSCAICTDVAWRPIRLDCGHLFCMRCMVKLQKQGWHDCPLCRAPNAVSSADERNLDQATGNVLKVWFPREVREKEKENEMDRKQEQKNEDADKCVIS